MGQSVRLRRAAMRPRSNRLEMKRFARTHLPLSRALLRYRTLGDLCSQHSSIRVLENFWVVGMLLCFTSTKSPFPLTHCSITHYSPGANSNPLHPATWCAPPHLTAPPASRLVSPISHLCAPAHAQRVERGSAQSLFHTSLCTGELNAIRTQKRFFCSHFYGKACR